MITIGILAFICIGICTFTSGVDATCCNFEQVQKDCNNVFKSRQNELLSCTLKTDFPAPDGSCPMDEHSPEGGLPDRGLPSSQIQLLTTDITWDTTCQLTSDMEDNCTRYQRDSTFITLDITFNLTGENIHGVHFDLRTLEGAVEPSAGSLDRSCHFLYLNQSLSDDIIDRNRMFTYSGFVGLHPGSRYRLKATTLTTNGTYTAFITREIEVQDCFKMEKNISQTDFFCNIPTPAYWPSTILLDTKTFDVTFTIWPEEGVFDYYFLYLLNGHSTESKIIDKEYMKYARDNIDYQIIDGINTTVMRHTFQGANEVQPGPYSVVVLPRPDKPCQADYHWGKQQCRVTVFPFTYNGQVSLPQDTDPPLTPSPPATIATATTDTTILPTKVLPTSVPSYLMTVLITLLVFLIVCLFFVCLWCCNIEIHNGQSILSAIQHCICGENINLDERTVTTFNWMHQYEPVSLAIPGRLLNHQFSNGSARNSIASCSDVEVSSIANGDCLKALRQDSTAS